jgi:predicted amidohydrolase YtcJ
MVGQGSPHLWFIGVSVATVNSCTTLRIPATIGSRGDGAEGGEEGRRVFQENCAFRPGSPGYQAVKEAVKTGLPIRNLHTGPLADKDIDYFLRAIEEAAAEAHLSEEQIRAQRHAIDHCYDNPRSDQIPFLRKYGIMMSCNTLNIHTSLPLDVKLYGEELAKRVVPRRSMIEGGVYTTSEIDRPIGPTVYTPFFYLYMNITRKGVDGKIYSPEERIDRISALKTFTNWAAPYVLREDMLGSLEPGKWADFMILDRDYLTIPEEDIPNIKGLATAVGGKFVHVRKEIAAELGEMPRGAQALLAP